MNSADISEPTRQVYGLLLMGSSVALFTVTSLLLGYMNDAHGVDGWVASAYRAGVGLTCVFLLQRGMGRLSPRRIFTRPLLLTRGLVGGLTIPVFYVTIMELGPGRAALIMGSYPLFAAVFAALLIREPMPRGYFPLIAVALTGLAAILADKGLAGGKPFYDFVAVLGAAAGGLCVVLIRHLRHTETTSNIFAAQCVFALVLGTAGAGSRLIIVDPLVLGLVLLASGTVVAAQLCLTEAFRHISVARGSTLQMLTPAFTALASAALLGEHLGPLEIFGGAAILFAACRISLTKPEREPQRMQARNGGP